VSGIDLPRLLPEGLARLSAYTPPEGDYPVRLDANESPFPPDPVVLDQIGRALEKMSLNRYPDPYSRGLRSAFAQRFQCSTQQVMAGNGSDELIGFLLWTLRASQGQSPPVVVIPTPTFAMYSIAALVAGYKVHEVPLTSGLEPDMEGMLRAVREKKPSIVFLSSPNNPTGTFYSREQVDALLGSSTGLVVVDEAYGDFSGEASWVAEVSNVDNLAVLRTLSKVGAAALRCGFLVAGCELLDQVNKVRFPFNLSRYTQVAGEIFLKNYESTRSRVIAVVRERDRLEAQLQRLSLKVFPSRGNFLLVQHQGKEEALWRFLQDGGIVVKFLPCLPVAGDALRITVGTPEENDQLMDRLKDFLAEGG